MSNLVEHEHGSELWPSSFQDLPLEAQIGVATQLSAQTSYLKVKPFIHSAANLDKITERLNKDTKGEFGWALSFDPMFISNLARHGFLPMAGQIFADLICLLPKLHQKRCLMLNLRDDLKISRGTMKQARHYEVSIDQALDEVIAAIQVQHGEHCWFYAPLTKAYRDVHAHNTDIEVFGIRIHSIEVWQPPVLAVDGAIVSPRRLVAGEVGYTVGSSYTSLSGFRLSDANGAGTVQCCAVAKLLQRCGFQMWDLGMGMTYKYELGAKDVPRKEFLAHLSAMREKPTESTGEGKSDAECVLKLDKAMLAVNLLKELEQVQVDVASVDGDGGTAAQMKKDCSASDDRLQPELSKRKMKVLAKKQAKMDKAKTTATATATATTTTTALSTATASTTAAAKSTAISKAITAEPDTHK